MFAPSPINPLDFFPGTNDLASAEHGQRPKPSKHGAIAERGSEAPPAMTGVEDVGCWKIHWIGYDWFKEKHGKTLQEPRLHGKCHGFL